MGHACLLVEGAGQERVVVKGGGCKGKAQSAQGTHVCVTRGIWKVPVLPLRTGR